MAEEKKVKPKRKRKPRGGAHGAPPKYRDTFPAEIIEMSKKGYTLSQICAQWGIHRETLWSWSKEKEKRPEFYHAYKEAKEHREVWWIKFGIQLMAGKVPKGNATAFVWMTKNILRWRDVPEEDNDESIEDLIFDE